MRIFICNRISLSTMSLKNYYHL